MHEFVGLLDNSMNFVFGRFLYSKISYLKFIYPKFNKGSKLGTVNLMVLDYLSSFYVQLLEYFDLEYFLYVTNAFIVVIEVLSAFYHFDFTGILNYYESRDQYMY